ncbi:MAG: valine--pyruvate transaminase, partial [Gammaproteobacteria bacterium]
PPRCPTTTLRAMKYSAFSERLMRDSGILRLMNDLGGAINRGGGDGDAQDVQMLGGGNPASIAAVERVFRAEMEMMLADGRAFERMVGNYDSPQGNDAFIEALAELLSGALGRKVRRDNIAITNGSQAGFGMLFNLFAGRGAGAPGKIKKILLPMTPEYIGYADLGPGPRPLFTAARPRIEELGEWQFKYRIDFERLRLGDDIGAVCISRPTNPSGNIVTDDELGRLRHMTRAAGVPLIVDGAYGPPFPGIVFTRATACWDENMILCLSLSKLGLPGARTGIIVAAAEIITRITQCNAIFTLAPGRFGPSLVTRLIARGELLPLCARHIAPYYRERSRRAMELVREAMRGLPVRAHASEGAIFLWLWFPALPISSDTLYQRLKQRGVLVVAGEHFFLGARRAWRHRQECIRVTFAGEAAQLERGIAIIGEEARRAYAAR